MSTNILRLPCGNNDKLTALCHSISQDQQLQTFWKCANVMAIDRMGYTDHGPIHVKIVANSALKLLRLLIESGITPSIVQNYGLTNDDAEVVVVLGSIFHDLGMAVVREHHEEYSLFLSLQFLDRHLSNLYSVENATIVSSEVLHALSTHHHQRKPLTVEAGVVRIADALDMEQGRARIPFQAGKIDIHSVSALSITSVTIEKGATKPVGIDISMTSPAGIFQIDQLLRVRIQNSGLEEYIHVTAKISDKRTGTQVIEKFEI
ncbi:MAG: HD domain-containing protein [Candidatus Bathyarchaeota archaeon]|jgi:metal-dependent HD superfamily phosphatase/phosphodiesterase|nr:HD domain-containing protein [Candidatus Bathyarchaeota archaeon]